MCLALQYYSSLVQNCSGTGDWHAVSGRTGRIRPVPLIWSIYGCYKKSGSWMTRPLGLTEAAPICPLRPRVPHSHTMAIYLLHVKFYAGSLRRFSAGRTGNAREGEAAPVGGCWVCALRELRRAHPGCFCQEGSESKTFRGPVTG